MHRRKFMRITAFGFIGMLLENYFPSSTYAFSEKGGSKMPYRTPPLEIEKRMLPVPIKITDKSDVIGLRLVRSRLDLGRAASLCLALPAT